MPLTEEFKQGKRDYLAGFTIDDCPWSDPAKEAEWINGWYRQSNGPTIH
jgi:ribosome modulation factor